MSNVTINDGQSLDSASKSGHPLRTWDDGFGPLWIYRECFGPVGIVRAQTWEDAWECVVDEIMDDADMDDAFDPACGANQETGELAEGCYFRGNGIPSNDGLNEPIASEDLNGSSLDSLSDDLASALGIEIKVSSD